MEIVVKTLKELLDITLDKLANEEKEKKDFQNSLNEKYEEFTKLQERFDKLKSDYRESVRKYQSLYHENSLLNNLKSTVEQPKLVKCIWWNDKKYIILDGNNLTNKEVIDWLNEIIGIEVDLKKANLFDDDKVEFNY